MTNRKHLEELGALAGLEAMTLVLKALAYVKSAERLKQLVEMMDDDQADALMSTLLSEGLVGVANGKAFFVEEANLEKLEIAFTGKGGDA
jgi:hypothetical protein